jgi:hypothetical protein
MRCGSANSSFPTFGFGYNRSVETRSGSSISSGEWIGIRHEEGAALAATGHG